MRVVSFVPLRARRGPEEWFTGTVRLEASPAGESPDARVFRVTFESGARTAAWHTHPECQILHVVTGEGRAQQDGGKVAELRPGDVVYFALGEKYWHGAAPDSAMVHVAVNPANASGSGTDWMEPVTDEEYGAGAG